MAGAGAGAGAGADPLQDVSWEVPYQGKPCYTAYCKTEVLIICQDDSLQVEGAVPRRSCELTDDDKKKIERLNITPTSVYDDASITAARYALDERFTSIKVQRSKPGSPLRRQKVMQMIQATFKTSSKPAVSVRYIGPGKKNTGDWCFQDGYITFDNIIQCYQDHFKGKLLTIFCDCSYGGNWVRSCMEYLHSQGVKPCAHSAKEKELFISTTASCSHSEIPYKLLYSIRAVITDKNTGTAGAYGSGWQVAEGQHIKKACVFSLDCKNKSIGAPCALGPHDTWLKVLNSDRIYLVRGNDKGRPAWHYVILVDDEETIRQFKELTQGENAGKHKINVSDYGMVVKSGWGQDPSNDVKEWMEEHYGGS